MHRLHELQRDFASSLQTGVPQSALPWISDTAATQRLQLYAHTVQGNHDKALAAIYPVCAQLVGERCFDGLSRRYRRLHPATSGDLHHYGARFADFIRTTPLVETVPYLVDVARLEWHYHRLFHARHVPPMDRQALAALSATDHHRLGFRLAPSAMLLVSPYPVHRIWAANQPGHTGALRMTAGEFRLLLHRPTFEVEMIPLDHGEYAFLNTLHTGRSLHAAIAAVLDCAPGTDPTPLLIQHLQRGTLTDYHLLEEAIT